MKHIQKIFLAGALPMWAVTGLTAANFTGPDGGTWGDGANWDTGTVPTAADQARMTLAENRTIDVNGDYTIMSVQDGFAPGALTLGGSGSLTIDVNSGSTALGIDNATGDAGGILQIDSTIVINNSAGNARTTMRNGNGASNVLRFNPSSHLVLNSGAQTTGTVGTIEFNGKISGAQPLFIGSTNASFGEGHDSSELGSVVFFLNSKLTVNGGTVLSPDGTKFQVNGVNAELELNNANSVNGANLSVGASNDLLVDVNADQENMGVIILPVSGQLTIDVDPSVNNLSFRSSYFQNWGSGSVTINGFREGTIRFGTDGTGLTREQLDVINGGIYSLTSEGYLTEETINYWAGFEIDELGYVLLAPWIELYAYAASAPYLWLVGGGWVYMEEVVGVNGYGWSYAYDLAGMQIYRTDESGFGYSFLLNRWVYSPDDVAGLPAGWFYVL